MDKEGQSAEFSSAQIPNKKSPDFFIGSNDKNTRQRRSFWDRIALFLNRFLDKLRNYFKHPFAGKHKIPSILAIIAIAIVVIVIILTLTVWRTTFSEDPSTPEEYEAWENELTSILLDVKPLSDEEAKNFFTNAINSTKKYGIKYYDLAIAFARDLIYRGYAGTAQTLLDSMDTDYMDCAQVANYYGAYAYLYFATNNENVENSTFNYYANLETEQEEICQDEYPAIKIEGEDN